jgi:pimeloyl-ACP methyl ester carboxylesterase
MGAAIALRLAVTRPELLRGLILIRPAWVTDDAPPNMDPNATVGRLIAEGADRAAFEATPMAQHLARTAPDNLASLRGFFDRQPLAQTAALLQAIAADGPGVSAADIGALDLPVLVCGTGRDHIHPLEYAGRLAALTGARLVELPPKATDKPAHLAALHAALTDFLKEF